MAVTLFDEPGAVPDAAPEARIEAAARRLKLVVAYDGTGFHGFWPNEGVATVGGTLAEAIERVLGHPAQLTCAGRTDAGVHAWGQVVTFDTTVDDPDPDRLQRALNGLCAPRIVVREATEVTADFDARGSARSRTYRYTVLNRTVPDPFLAATTWHVAAPLDLRAMVLGCDAIIGEHDFSSFCRRPRREGSPADLTRRVIDARWDDRGEGRLRFEITANAFCHQMVRSLVGTLVAVGRVRIRAGEVLSVIRARDRAAAGPPAPPHGLCLWSVGY